MSDKIEIESSKFNENESFIVNYFNDEGKDFDEEHPNLKSAISFLIYQFDIYHSLDGSSFNNLMAEPCLSHPSGSGLLWNIELECWE